MKNLIVITFLAAVHSAQPYAAIVDPTPVAETTDEIEARILRLTERLERIRDRIKVVDADG